MTHRIEILKPKQIQPRISGAVLFTNVETKFDDVTGAHDVVAAFGTHFAGTFGGGFRTKGN